MRAAEDGAEPGVGFAPGRTAPSARYEWGCSPATWQSLRGSAAGDSGQDARLRPSAPVGGPDYGDIGPGGSGASDEDYRAMVDRLTLEMMRPSPRSGPWLATRAPWITDADNESDGPPMGAPR
jgi:hypothetical protein